MSRVQINRNYDALIDALRERKAELGLTDAAVDDAAGLQSGYCAKLLGPKQGTTFGRVSFGPMLEVLAVKVILEPDPETEARITSQIPKRKKPPTNGKRLSIGAAARLFPKMFAALGRRGAKARMKKTTAEQRSEISRNNANARWAKERARQAELNAASLNAFRHRRRSF